MQNLHWLSRQLLLTDPGVDNDHVKSLPAAQRSPPMLWGSEPTSALPCCKGSESQGPNLDHIPL
jgi:hypothetical protein